MYSTRLYIPARDVREFRFSIQDTIIGALFVEPDCSDRG